MLSCPVSVPIFISPAALARLGHPGGEVNMVKAAGREGIIQAISINASCSIDEIVEARLPDQPLVFQLYMNRARRLSELLIQRIERCGFKAIMLTVDAAVPGKREKDLKTKSNFTGPGLGGSVTGVAAGISQAISGYQDPDVCWEDIAWIKQTTNLPLIIKGIQCVEDAEKAYDHGVQGIVLSNHGGRQLDFSPAPMTVLYELHLRRPDLLEKFDVFIDGGVTRGTDVLKALCLGARGVGLGRAFLYANAVWGEAGVQRVIQSELISPLAQTGRPECRLPVMREEIERGMALLGVTRIEDLKSDMVCSVERDVE